MPLARNTDFQLVSKVFQALQENIFSLSAKCFAYEKILFCVQKDFILRTKRFYSAYKKILFCVQKDFFYCRYFL